MIKRIVTVLLTIAIIVSFTSCTKDDIASIPVISNLVGVSSDSTFSIQFIDVGQGDSALVECDGRYMLIDGGDVSAGDKVYNVLESKGIQHLDLLVMSHLHADHIGGLAKALTYASQIDKTIASADDIDTEAFKKVTHELSTNGSKITVPEVGDKYKFGSASVEVIDMPPKTADSFEKNENDSVALMITYGHL